MQRLRTRLRAGASTFPSATFALNFLTGGLDPAVTFTRSTTATFVGSDGLIQSAAINAPRFDYDPVTLAAKGLLIEEQRTNLLIYSQQFDNAAYAKTGSTISANAATAPDGTVTADKLVENTSTGLHEVRRTPTASASTAHTQSIFIKAGERTKGQLQMFGSAGGSTVTFDLVAGTATATGAYGGWASAYATITPFGDGWYRITNTATTNGTVTAVGCGVYLSDASGSGSYTGDGTSGLFIWGAQFEAGAFATSYIPTVASQVTRSADVASMTGTNFSSWYNASEGSFVASYEASPNTFTTYLAVSNGVVAQNSMHMDNDGSGNMRVAYYSGSSAVALLTLGTIGTIGAVSNIGTAYKVNDFAATRNGGTVATDTAGAVPVSVNRLNIGADPSGAAVNVSNGHIRSIAYYNTRLPNDTLQALTA